MSNEQHATTELSSQLGQFETVETPLFAEAYCALLIKHGFNFSTKRNAKKDELYVTVDGFGEDLMTAVKYEELELLHATLLDSFYPPNQSEFQPEITTLIRWARQCSKTGKGMNEGFILGEEYFAHQSDADNEARLDGYRSMADAYRQDPDNYYWTSWEDPTDDQFVELPNGEIVDIEDDPSYQASVRSPETKPQLTQEQTRQETDALLSVVLANHKSYFKSIVTDFSRSPYTKADFLKDASAISGCFIAHESELTKKDCVETLLKFSNPFWEHYKTNDRKDVRADRGLGNEVVDVDYYLWESSFEALSCMGYGIVMYGQNIFPKRNILIEIDGAVHDWEILHADCPSQNEADRSNYICWVPDDDFYKPDEYLISLIRDDHKSDTIDASGPSC